MYRKKHEYLIPLAESALRESASVKELTKEISVPCSLYFSSKDRLSRSSQYVQYEPETSAPKVSSVKTADVTTSEPITVTVPLVLVKGSTSITLDTPEVICTNKLTTAMLELQKGGKMSGNIEHTGGSLSSNGKVLHTHKHPGDSGGITGAPDIGWPVKPEYYEAG